MRSSSLEHKRPESSKGQSSIDANYNTCKIGFNETYPRGLERFRETATGRLRDIVVFLDYDGTLTEIVPNPFNQRRKILRGSKKTFPTAIIISGRSLETVRRFVDLKSVHFAGSHDMDMELPLPGAPIEGVLEIRPKYKWNKGCVAQFICRSGNALPIFIGDDRTDENAFRLSEKLLCALLFEIHYRGLSISESIDGMENERRGLNNQCWIGSAFQNRYLNSNMICRFVPLDGLNYAGSHNMDLELPGAPEKLQKIPLMIAQVERTLKEKLKTIEGKKLENNKFSLSIHYRHVKEDVSICLTILPSFLMLCAVKY
ncbi:hypothetical protein ACFE04_011240 [Oxalis oulophora]